MTAPFDLASEYKAMGDDLKGVAYEGDYQMKVTKVVASQTAKGKAQWLVTLSFTSGPLAAKGKSVVDRLIWSPESEVAARIFSQSMAKLGATQDWIIQARPTPNQIGEKLLGTVVDVSLKPDEFNGQPQTRVSYKKTVSVGAAAPVGTPVATISPLDEVDDQPAAPAPAAAPAAPATAEAPAQATAAPTSTVDADNPWA